MQSVAMPWLALQLTHNPFLVGLVLAAQFTPVLLGSQLGGVVADRYRKRTVLLVTQTLLLLVTGTLAVLVATGLATLLLTGLATFYFSDQGNDQLAYATAAVGARRVANPTVFQNRGTGIQSLLPMLLLAKGGGGGACPSGCCPKR